MNGQLESVSNNLMLYSPYIFLVCVVALFWLGKSITGSTIIGMVVAESVNIFNLTMYIAPQLGMTIKPFAPLWMSVVLFVLPWVFLPILLHQNILLKEKSSGKQN